MAKKKVLVTKEQRDEILRLYVVGEVDRANELAISIGRAPHYAYRLARERGAIPFTSRGQIHREREPYRGNEDEGVDI